MMFNDYDDILSVEQLMELLYIGKNSTYKLLNSGAIKAFRIGKVWKIPRVALEEYIISKSKLNPLP